MNIAQSVDSLQLDDNLTRDDQIHPRTPDLYSFEGNSAGDLRLEWYFTVSQGNAHGLIVGGLKKPSS